MSLSEVKAKIEPKSLEIIEKPVEEFRETYLGVINKRSNKDYKDYTDEVLDEELTKSDVGEILQGVMKLETAVRKIIIEEASLDGNKTEKLEYMIIVLKSATELFDLYTDMYNNL